MIRSLIVSAALSHGVNVAVMDHMAKCESSYRPFAVNGPNIGLFQLSSQGKLREFYPWAEAQGLLPDPFDPSQQINFTADELLAGAGPAWSCYPRWLPVLAY